MFCRQGKSLPLWPDSSFLERYTAFAKNILTKECAAEPHFDARVVHLKRPSIGEPIIVVIFPWEEIWSTGGVN